MRLNTRTFLLLAVVLAFAIRAAWILATDTQITAFSDAQFYDAAARNLVAGRGYAVDMDFERGWVTGGNATAFFPPGYSTFLAGIYAATGSSIEAAKWANALLGALTVVPCFVIANRLSRPTARLATLLAATLPVFVIPTPVVLSEPLFCLLILSAAALLMTEGRGRFWAGAALVGFAVLVRPMAFLLVPALAVWWIWTGGSVALAVKRSVALTVVCVAIVAPWFVRNQVVLGHPVLVSTNFGYNLRVGHAPYSNGTHKAPTDLWAERRATFQEQELEVFQSEAAGRALDYALSHPGREVSLTLSKVFWQWAPDLQAIRWVSSWADETRTPLSRSDLMLSQAVLHVALLGLTAVGLAKNWGSPAAKWTITIALVWTLAHVLFFGLPRFNLPILYLLLPLAAAAVPRTLPLRRNASLREQVALGLRS